MSATRHQPDLGDVSLVCVETRYPELARYAIERCLAAATFKECLLLSPTRHALPDYIRQVQIAPIDSVAAYSAFMLRELGRHFSGSHVLVITTISARPGGTGPWRSVMAVFRCARAAFTRRWTGWTSRKPTRRISSSASATAMN
jgi:hypothetical protein